MFGDFIGLTMDQMVKVNPKSPQALIQHGDYLVRSLRDGTTAEGRRRRVAARTADLAAEKVLRIQPAQHDVRVGDYRASYGDAGQVVARAAENVFGRFVA